MIIRSKLAEQLRYYQIRSQYKCRALTTFSPKPQITSRADVVVAIFWASVFKVLVVSFPVSLYFRHFPLSFVIFCLGIILPVRPRMQALARKERRLLLPLSM